MATPAELQPQVITALWEKYAQFDGRLAQWFPPRPNLTFGPHVRYDVQSFNTQMAPAVARHGPAPSGRPPTRATVNIEAITLKEVIKPEIVAMLDGTAPGSLSESNRERAASDAIRQIRLHFDRRLEWLRAQWLTGGAMLSSAGVAEVEPSGTIYLDYANALLRTGPMSQTIGLSATHVDAGASASWATAATDIRADLEVGRLLNLQDSGVETWDVLMNSTTHGYLIGNTLAQKSLLKNDAVARDGYIRELWGYTFHIYDGCWYPNTYSMGETAAAESTAHKYVPDAVCVIFSGDNIASGRSMVECSPSDAQADQNLRGLYAWEDADPRHPHHTEYGLEYTASPAIMNPDSMYIYTKVTDTS